jgi:hypothetical protein
MRRRLALAFLVPVGTLIGLARPGPGTVALAAHSQIVERRPADAMLTRPIGRTEDRAGSGVAEPVPTPADVAALIDQAFPPGARQQALAIAWCESRLEADVVGTRNANGTRDWGVFQLNDGGTLQHLDGTPQSALDAEWNVLAARRLYDEEGFAPWTCRGGTEPVGG